VVAAGLALLAAFSLPSFCNVRGAGVRIRATNNLKQIGLALHNYHDIKNHLPPAVHRGKNGEPLLSWRVLILPYMECDNLYCRFHLDEPWDSPHNLTLLPEMNKVYASVGEQPPEPYMTFIQAFVGPGAAFEGDTGLRLPDDFPDGTSSTFLVVEAGEAVPWSKPVDLVYDPAGALPSLGGVFRGGNLLSGSHMLNGFNAVFADGSVRTFLRTTSEETIRALITRNGGEKVPD
jgi:prepilin-type processing-associated H-X9-DG protein